MKKIDDRTVEQQKTLRWLVVGTDSFMTKWGNACGAIHGSSIAAWACDKGHLNACESYVRQRGDMLRVRIVLADTYRPKGTGHFHIYVFRTEVPTHA